MEIRVQQGNIAQFQADCIVVNLFQGVTEPGGATAAVDAALGGAIRELIAAGDFVGESGTTVLLHARGRLPASWVLVVGLGSPERFDHHRARRAAAAAVRALRKVPSVRHLATVVHGGGAGGLDVSLAARSVAEGTLLAAYRMPQYRREVPEPRPERCTVVEFAPERLAAVEKGVAQGRAIVQGVSTARDLVAEPPNILTPAEMAARARRVADQVGLKVTVLDEAAMRELGMGILLAVSQGSAQEAQLIVLEHAPEGHREEPPWVVVGKGITFDTGGISLKRAENMWYMKDDMGGAAAVIGALEAVARLQVPRRVIGVAACVENMPDGRAYRPGDILTGMTGKTVEVISTDAEGRLVLADALAYVARFRPQAVVDLATLTGAIGVALGSQAAGCFANDPALQEALLAAAERSGERLWPMPMWEEYKESIRSDMAEVKNSGGRRSGVSSSAKFLEHFTEGYPWAHLDIASMVWVDNGQVPELPAGPTGYGVRLLVHWLAGEHL